MATYARDNTYFWLRSRFSATALALTRSLDVWAALTLNRIAVPADENIARAITAAINVIPMELTKPDLKRSANIFSERACKQIVRS